MALVFCPECGTQVSEHAMTCTKCGYPVNKLKEIQGNLKSAGKSNSETIVNEYYRNEFHKIKSNENNIGSKYYGKWNWFAFLFTWIWYFVKGCYLNGITILLSNIGIVMLFQRLWNHYKDSQFAPFCWFSEWQYVYFAWGIVAIYSGINGTWDYYNYKELNKKWVTPPLQNFLKLVVGIIVLAVLFYAYEKLFDPMIYHGRGVD